MSKHNPKTCASCRRQGAELRHPVYRRLRSLLVVPGPRRGGAA
ncbi:hypothetical protein ACFWR6_19645 [Streptomyces griseus]